MKHESHFKFIDMFHSSILPSVKVYEKFFEGVNYMRIILFNYSPFDKSKIESIGYVPQAHKFVALKIMSKERFIFYSSGFKYLCSKEIPHYISNETIIAGIKDIYIKTIRKLNKSIYSKELFEPNELVKKLRNILLVSKELMDFELIKTKKQIHPALLISKKQKYEIYLSLDSTLIKILKRKKGCKGVKSLYLAKYNNSELSSLISLNELNEFGNSRLQKIVKMIRTKYESI